MRGRVCDVKCVRRRGYNWENVLEGEFVHVVVERVVVEGE